MSYLSHRSSATDAQSWRIGRAAIRALHRELIAFPKPGLVSPIDTGAHDDMDATTFLRSLFALRRYFVEIAAEGAAGAPFETLSALGRAAEARMMMATGGINTHRGAIFTLGLLAAAAGWQVRHGLSCRGADLTAQVVERWGDGIARAAHLSSASHGATAGRFYGARGARDEALEGFPTLMRISPPAPAGEGPDAAAIQALFAAMAELEDTNLLHRGGLDGLRFVQTEARRFLDEGGVTQADWHERALALHQSCIARRLSPGGSADLLAAACFLGELHR
jgi:triphosphoribosyl-dephospho-CoA synthase